MRPLTALVRRSRHAALTGFMLAATTVTVVLSQSPGQAAVEPPACPSTGISVAAVQPVDGGVFRVARLAGANAGDPPSWEMKLDAWACNMSIYDLMPSAKVQHWKGSELLRTVRPNLKSAYYLPAGSGLRLSIFRDQTQHPYPLPTSITVIFNFQDRDSFANISTIKRTYQVAEQSHPGPVGGYFFPTRQSDLPLSHYWNQYRHNEDNTYQRYAYDLGVVRWTGSKWDSYKAGSDHTRKESHLAWDRPVYAMSDGEIIGCNRGAADNEPRYVDGQPTGPTAQGAVRGGNILWIRTGNETHLYAHLKQFSIPFALCPWDDDAEHKAGDPFQTLRGDARYMVKAGQYLGQTGNSGSSTGGPHLHIHSFMGLPAIWGGSEVGFDADARPMKFVNIRTQAITTTNVVESKWNALTTPALPNYNVRIQANRCGFMPAAFAAKPEVVQAGVVPSCVPDLVNAMRQAGLRPVHLDVQSGSGTNVSVWRPDDGSSWQMFYGLTASQLVSRNTTYVGLQGYRYVQLESYAVSGGVRYAVIYAKGQPGPKQDIRAGMSASTFQSDFNTKVSRGYRPVNISVAVSRGTPLYTALYEKADVGAFVAKPRIPLSGYQAEFDRQIAAGRQPAHLDGYELNGTPYVSAIFQSGLKGSYQASHGLTGQQLTSLEASNLSAGRFARTVTAYMTSGLRRYVAVWRQAPETTITSGPTSGGSTTASLAFTATDSTATFECRLDAGSWTVCSSPATWSSLAPGTHTLDVRARDRLGLRDTTPASRTWTISPFMP